MTAVEWFIDELKSNGVIYEGATPNGILFKQAKELEKQQHGETWDSAIKAHDDRGHVHARSIVDFDEYYNETYKTQAQ